MSFSRSLVRFVMSLLASMLTLTTISVWRQPSSMWAGLSANKLNDFLVSSAFCLLNIWNIYTMLYIRLLAT